MQIRRKIADAITRRKIGRRHLPEGRSLRSEIAETDYKEIIHQG